MQFDDFEKCQAMFDVLMVFVIQVDFSFIIQTQKLSLVIFVYVCVK